jgi:pyochelin synthetase
MSITNNLDLNERLSRLSPEKRALLALKLSKSERQNRPEKTVALPKVQPDPENRFAPFILSDIQQAYLIGRQEGVELGNIACHNYFEVDLADWKEERFEAALDKLIRRHEMLRCIVLPEGRQQILKEVPKYTVRCGDFRGKELSAAEAHIEMYGGKWPNTFIPRTYGRFLKFAPPGSRQTVRAYTSASTC